MNYKQMVEKYKKELYQVEQVIYNKENNTPELDKCNMAYHRDLCALYRERCNLLVLICAFSHINLDSAKEK